MVKILVEVAGWIGTLLVLFAYQQVSFKGREPGPSFYVMNVVGGAGLTLNAAVNGAWPSVGLNVVWVAVGVASLIRFRSRARDGGVRRGDPPPPPAPGRPGRG
jgi:hypothetical protein